MNDAVFQLPAQPAAKSERAQTAPLARSAVLVGLMGAGKSSVGRRLARLIGAGFIDADDEIVTAAAMSIPDIFASYGEPAFRDLERRVIMRLLDQPPMVLALGGGAFIDPAVRDCIKGRATSIWLRADLDTLVCRVTRKRASRPLLAGEEPRAVLERLMATRYPIYALADHMVETASEPAELVATRLVPLVKADA